MRRRWLWTGATCWTAPTMLNYRWMYDEDPQIGLMLRSDFRSRHKDARLKLAGLLADGPESGLARAEELYSGLCGEDLENDPPVDSAVPHPRADRLFARVGERRATIPRRPG